MFSTEGSIAEVLAGTRCWHLGHGDALELLEAIPDASLDSMVTDPPGGIDFMGKEWDSPLKYSVGGLGAVAPHLRKREVFVWWLTERMQEAYRVLKPGAHILVWSLPRTAHWTGTAIENAGFEIIDTVSHLFSQGASKSKSARRMLAMAECALPGRHFESALPAESEPDDHVCADHAPETEWDGHGTGLAPAHEDWWLARKPLDGTIAENLATYGTGVMDIDGSRIPEATGGGRWPKDVVLSHSPGCKQVGTSLVPANPTWDTPNRDTAPAAFTGKRVSKVRHGGSREGEPSAKRRYTEAGPASLARTPGRRRDAVEEIDVWECEAGCAVFALAEQGGETQSGFMRAGAVRSVRQGTVYGAQRAQTNAEDTIADSGPVTRFYLQLATDPSFVPFRYQAKPTRAEKDAGLHYFRRRSGAEATESKDGQARLQNARTGAGRTGGVRNMHATVKGKKFVQYLIRLVTPKGGVVLDLFSGSGTHGAAAVELGYRYIGFELLDTDAEPHASIARARITWAAGGECVPRESLRQVSTGDGLLEQKEPP